MIDSSLRTVRYVAQSDALPIPPHDAWLTAAEQSELSAWAHPARRQQWLAGRWVAKRIVAQDTTAEEHRRVEILSRRADGLGTAPRVTVDSIPLRRRLSISHAGRAVLVGLSSAEARIGVDLALNVPFDAKFRRAWFTEGENDWLGDEPQRRATILWGLKEAIFKSHSDGAAWNPRVVEILRIDEGRISCAMNGVALAPLAAWVRSAPRGVATVVWESQPWVNRAATRQEVAACS